MSSTVKSPNQKSNGFLWAVIAVVVIAAVVIGYIIISGQSKSKVEFEGQVEPVAMSQQIDDEAFKLTAEDSAKTDDKTPKVEIYEDFLCPSCAELAMADKDQLKDAIEAGDMDVAIRTMSFLDRGNEDGQSHHILAAVYAVGESGDAELYWNYRQYLLEHQQDIYKQWGDEELADLAGQMGADGDVVSNIRDGKFTEEARQFGKDNEDRLRDTEGGVSSPRIFVDGKEIELSSDWVEKTRR